jgi:hypothetical protein
MNEIIEPSAEDERDHLAEQCDHLLNENNAMAELLELVQERAFVAQDFELCAAIETVLVRRHMAEAVEELILKEAS